MIQGRLSYASNAFYPSLQIGNMEPLTRLTKCAIRGFFGLPPWSRTSPIFEQLRLTTLEDMFNIKLLIHHRDYLADFHFKITNSERRPNKIILPKFKSLSKSLFMFRTAILWNCLPPSLTSEASLYKFKAALRKFTADYAYAINGIPPPCS